MAHRPTTQVNTHRILWASLTKAAQEEASSSQALIKDRCMNPWPMVVMVLVECTQSNTSTNGVVVMFVVTTDAKPKIQKNIHCLLANPDALKVKPSLVHSTQGTLSYSTCWDGVPVTKSWSYTLATA